MKIVFATPGYPPRTGGVETHIHEIATRLVARNHEVTVVTGDARHVSTPRRERRGGVRVVRCQGVAPNDAFHLAPGVASAVRRLDTDIVHAHNYHALVLPFAAIGAGDRPLVVTPHYHGGSASSLRDRLLSLYHPVGRQILQRAAAVVAVSDWERDRLQEDFGVKARVIRNGVDVVWFAEATPLNRDRPYILTVGRLEKYKGVQYAIRALQELSGYDLLVAGSGPYREILARTAREIRVDDRVEFLGYVDNDELPSLYAGAEVYLALSNFEAYGLTVGEALAAGTPCVVRPAGGLTDWLGRNGIVEASSTAPAAVARSVRRAKHSTTECLREGLPTWDAAATQIVDTYHEACRGE
jgi:glycosyltransferase involved in cell wall biosynthesis